MVAAMGLRSFVLVMMQDRITSCPVCVQSASAKAVAIEPPSDQGGVQLMDDSKRDAVLLDTTVMSARLQKLTARLLR